MYDCKNFKELRDTFFNDIAILAWCYIDDKDEDSGASYVMACVGLLDEIADKIKKDFEPKSGSGEEVFKHLYTSGKLNIDYSELYQKSTDWEASINYGRLEVISGEIDLEEHLSEMEQLLDELVSSFDKSENG